LDFIIVQFQNADTNSDTCSQNLYQKLSLTIRLRAIMLKPHERPACGVRSLVSGSRYTVWSHMASDTP